MIKNIKNLVLILIIIVSSTLVWAYFVFFLSGSFVAKYSINNVNIAGGRGVLSRFSPDTRVIAKDGAVVLSGDPIYFSFYAARPISRLKLRFEYKADLSPEQPLVEAGVLMGEKGGNYQLKPLENYWLNQYSSWPQLYFGSTRIYDRDGQYNSADDFWGDFDKGYLQGCPRGIYSCLATYKYDLAVGGLEHIYSTSGFSSIPAAIKGPHQFYVAYPESGLKLDFSAFAKDGIKDRVISFEAYSQDGKRLDSGYFLDIIDGGETKGVFEVSGSTIGSLVKILVKADRNIVISHLQVNSPILSFVNRIDLVSDDYNLPMFTNRPFIMLQTSNPLAKGSYSLGGAITDVSSTFQQFSVRSSDVLSIYPIRLHYGDIEVANNGLISFSPESLASGSSMIKVDQYFDSSPDISYIVADYSDPQINADGWKSAEIEFDMHGAYRENNRYQLILSLPQPFSQLSYPVYIKKVEAKASATSIWEKIGSIITR
jgi:hypothetical protein